MRKDLKAFPFFLKGCQVSLISLLLLILAGGIVRSSGSGMGCPDWPKCFNRFIPPTSEEELPKGYHEVFLKKRLKKNMHLASILEGFGFKNLASQIKADPDIYKIESFNAFNTWTEYINRLIGMLTGLSFLSIFILSFFIPKGMSLVWIAGINLVLIFFEAYLGSIVVSTHLLPGIISVHMLLALFILFLLILLYRNGLNLQQASKKEVNLLSPPIKSRAINYFYVGFGLTIALSLIQILMGTGIRESIDAYQGKISSEADLIGVAGTNFILHRGMSLVIFGVHFLLGVLIWKNGSSNSPLRKQILICLSILIFQILLGVSLEMGALPPASQALHVFMAVSLFTCQVWGLFLAKSPNFDTENFLVNAYHG